MFWLCVTLTAVSIVMSANLWRELKIERDVAAVLRTNIAQEAAGDSTGPPAAAATRLAPARQAGPEQAATVTTDPASNRPGVQ
jgi:hypothetical protein